MTGQIDTVEQALSTLFTDKELCTEELHKARKVMGSTTATMDDWKKTYAMLNIIRYYCSSDILPMVESSIEEMQLRQLIIMEEELKTNDRIFT